MKTVLTAAAALGLLAASNTAFANEVVTESIEVSFHDIDLTTQEGQAKMDRRIARAARNVCKVETTKSLAPRAARECYAAAMKQGRIEMAKRAEDIRYGG